MNDFTKEDLENLRDYCGITANHGYASNCDLKMANKLWYKLDSMIDSYCEHEYKLSNEAHFKCCKCGDRESE